MSRSIWTVLFIVAATVSCDYKPRNQGKALYQEHCQSCHMESGQGLGKLIPPVANADYVVENKEKLACIIRYGVEGVMVVNGVEYYGAMEGNRQLSDIEVNNLVHYILVDLNDQKEHFVIAEVKDQLETCEAP